MADASKFKPGPLHKLTDEQMNYLIEKYANHPSLWNIKIVEYRNKQLKKTKWTSMQMNCFFFHLFSMMFKCNITLLLNVVTILSIFQKNCSFAVKKYRSVIWQCAQDNPIQSYNHVLPRPQSSKERCLVA